MDDQKAGIDFLSRGIVIRMMNFFIRKTDEFLSAWVLPENLVVKEWRGKAPLQHQEKEAREPQSGINPDLKGGVSLRSMNRRLCFFAHFDPQNQIDDYVVYYLKELKKLGTDIIFISTAKDLPENEIEKISEECSKIILRKNLTLDFGSWCIGWLAAQKDLGLSLSNYHQLILANDSVYGPLFPLGKIFDSMQSRNLDFWSITSSAEQTDHLQSYFLVLSSQAFQSYPFDQFWEKFRFYRSKKRIIEDYEIGLSRLAQKENWKMGTWIEHQNTDRKDLNPTLFSWDSLIEKHHCPFLKTEVLRLNRAQSARISDWKKIVARASSYPVVMMEKHKNRISRQRH